MEASKKDIVIKKANDHWAFLVNPTTFIHYMDFLSHFGSVVASSLFFGVEIGQLMNHLTV